MRKHSSLGCHSLMEPPSWPGSWLSGEPPSPANLKEGSMSLGFTWKKGSHAIFAIFRATHCFSPKTRAQGALSDAPPRSALPAPIPPWSVRPSGPSQGSASAKSTAEQCGSSSRGAPGAPRRLVGAPGRVRVRVSPVCRRLFGLHTPRTQSTGV